MKVAETILEQIGGNKFMVMTGAKNLVGSDNSLMFQLPNNFAVNKANKCRVTLNELDLYDIEFFNIRGMKVKEISKQVNIPADQLKEVFEHQTGLDTYI